MILKVLKLLMKIGMGRGKKEERRGRKRREEEEEREGGERR